MTTTATTTISTKRTRGLGEVPDGRRRKASDHPIPGEVWKSAPNGLISVSDQGRAMTMNGHLITPIMAVRGRRTYLTWWFKAAGRSYGLRAATLIAQVFLGGSPRDGVCHLNGDVTDLRVANLRIPWSPEQDEVIRQSATPTEAAHELGLSWHKVARRAKTLGKSWPTVGRVTYGVPLADRLEAAQAAIALLKRKGVPSRDIVIALGLGKRGPRGSESASVDACLKVLADQLSPAEIATAMGWKRPYSVVNRLRRLGLADQTGWDGGTIAGPPETLDGEEWRRHPVGVWVSSMGRIATERGLRKIDRRRANPCLNIWVEGRLRAFHVARLMLEVFRPGLPYSSSVFLNGDAQDVRLANIVGAVDAEAAARQIRARIYGNFTPQERSDIVQAGVLAMMEGRASTPAEAFKAGLGELRDIAGIRHDGRAKNWSLDELDEDGRTLLDRMGV